MSSLICLTENDSSELALRNSTTVSIHVRSVGFRLISPEYEKYCPEGARECGWPSPANEARDLWESVQARLTFDHRLACIRQLAAERSTRSNASRAYRQARDRSGSCNTSGIKVPRIQRTVFWTR